jgi:hypothetical protein
MNKLHQNYEHTILLFQVQEYAQHEELDAHDGLGRDVCDDALRVHILEGGDGVGLALGGRL